MRNLFPAIILALPSSGCALVLQEHLPAKYDHRAEEPHCNGDYGLAILDSALSALSISSALAAQQLDAEGEAKDQKNYYVASAIAGAAVHTVSSVAGFQWADECDAAREKRTAYMKERLDVAQATKRKRQPLFRRREEQRPVFGNGFFCSSINCARDLETCQDTRLPDEQPCAEQTSAFCFGNERFRVCRPTLAACERQMDLSGYGKASSCDETQ